MATPHYEIRVSGVLPPEALLDFEYLTASVEPVETVLYGELADLAALQGLLARLETFGVNVLRCAACTSIPRPATAKVRAIDGGLGPRGCGLTAATFSSR